ncbi:hypothetical protein [Virgibacillus proomii]|uniref:hypothetical protein n=1 Tax=Virgibacillus proomii TaxID=84407 RepID=UPI001C11A00C|nr:hypothetical protein [Virgibacillus proomii]MBU5265736.1 hypothetical protein [Virgibacillus proomii]
MKKIREWHKNLSKPKKIVLWGIICWLFIASAVRQYIGEDSAYSQEKSKEAVEIEEREKELEEREGKLKEAERKTKEEQRRAEKEREKAEKEMEELEHEKKELEEKKEKEAKEKRERSEKKAKEEKKKVDKEEKKKQENKKTKKENKVAVKEKDKKNPKPKKKKDLESWVVKTINDELGKESNTDKKRIAKVDLIDYVFTEDNDKDRIVNVHINADDSFTSKMIGTGILSNSSDVFQRLFKDKRVAEVGLFWQLGTVDKYGNTSEDVIARIILKRDTFEKINFDKFLYQDFEHVADSFFMRDEFKEHTN